MALTPGGIYSIRARNFTIGVFNGEGFTGIREKFGHTHLAEELLWEDGSPHGTVQLEPRILIGQILPGIPLTTTLGVRCETCSVPVEWAGEWAGCACAVAYPRMVENTRLYTILVQAEDPDVKAGWEKVRAAWLRREELWRDARLSVRQAAAGAWPIMLSCLDA